MLNVTWDCRAETDFYLARFISRVMVVITLDSSHYLFRDIDASKFNQEFVSWTFEEQFVTIDEFPEILEILLDLPEDLELMCRMSQL